MRLCTTDPQEMFDLVTAHLAGLPRQATNANGACQYLTQDGLRCAAGALITDATDDELRELAGSAETIGPAIGLNNDSLHHPDWALVQFLNELQYCHDEVDNWDPTGRFVEWQSMRWLAQLHDLDTAVLEAVSDSG